MRPPPFARAGRRTQEVGLIDGFPRRSARRCSGCGSTLLANERNCSVCGTRVPWRLTRRGVLVESAAAVVGLAAIVAAILVWRSGAPGQLPAPPAVVLRGTDVAVVVPPTMAVSVATAVVTATATLPPLPTPAAPPALEHTIASGDTLWNIASENDTTVEAILAANVGELTLDRLSIGQVIKIPLSDALPPADALVQEAPPAVDAAAPATDTLAADILARAGAADGLTVVVQAVSVTVAADDTLSTLAEANGVTVEDVVAANGLADADAILQLGQVLVMKTAEVVTATPLPGGIAGGQPGSDAGQAAQQEPLTDDADRYAAPLALSPLFGTAITGDAPMLRWSSIGRLPPGIAYIVLLNEADAPIDEAVRVTVRGGATAARIPARFRPALGASRELVWAVAVGRIGDSLLGSDDPTVLSGDVNWIAFTWTVGDGPTPSVEP
ncbi:MAG: LysM peptidoglycan-binding domain-containing protein [Ardenticatenales bacterium]|nr:LysM peptidoglycan-binding domain-containing protein [Ardenticatenales bacterium]